VDQKPQDKKPRDWSWKLFGIALSLIVIGLLTSFVALCLMWAEGWEVLVDYLEVYGVAFCVGLCIAVVGIIWIIILLIELIPLRDRSRRS